MLETRDFYPYGLEMPGRSYLSGTKAKENFTGHERDAETGMLYAGARYYMPNIGRWTSGDPLHQYASQYVYVGNNPMRFVDPSGLWGSEPHASTSWMGSTRHGILSGGLATTELVTGRTRSVALGNERSNDEPQIGAAKLECPTGEQCPERESDSDSPGIVVVQLEGFGQVLYGLSASFGIAFDRDFNIVLIGSIKGMSGVAAGYGFGFAGAFSRSMRLDDLAGWSEHGGGYGIFGYGLSTDVSVPHYSGTDDSVTLGAGRALMGNGYGVYRGVGYTQYLSPVINVRRFVDCGVDMRCHARY